jgi:hypothetical protein
LIREVALAILGPAAGIGARDVVITDNAFTGILFALACDTNPVPALEVTCCVVARNWNVLTPPVFGIAVLGAFVPVTVAYDAFALVFMNAASL